MNCVRLIIPRELFRTWYEKARCMRSLRPLDSQMSWAFRLLAARLIASAMISRSTYKFRDYNFIMYKELWKVAQHGHKRRNWKIFFFAQSFEKVTEVEKMFKVENWVFNS